MTLQPNDSPITGITRRQFVKTATAVAGLMMAKPARAQETDSQPATQPVPTSQVSLSRDFAIGMIGTGSQGQELMKFVLKYLAPSVRFVAVCDIWPYWREYSAKLLDRYDQPVNAYEDYREMLDKEQKLDAVIVATPDWMHAEHTVACLRAGKHVYCEKEMSNTLEGARQMVLAARETGNLLQIGHQRRSQPRYWHALKMIEKDKILGRITHCYGQWNRARLLEQGWPKKEVLDQDTLQRYGYGSMEELRNWRWYRRYSGGPIADLGSHQIDIFNWFLKARPKAVQASGGLDYYGQQKGRDWYDNIMTIYEYETELGPARAFYQVLNTTSYGGFYEQFMGDEGSLLISDDGKTGEIYREVHAAPKDWEAEADKVEKMGKDVIELKIGETLTADGKKTAEGQRMAAEAMKDSRQLHLENFFKAICGEAELTSPGEHAYETCVTVLRANDAVASGRRYEFDPNEFTV